MYICANVIARKIFVIVHVIDSFTLRLIEIAMIAGYFKQ